MRAGARWIGMAAGAVAAGAIAAAAVTMSGQGLPETLAQSSPDSPNAATADRKVVTMQYGSWKVTCEEAAGSSSTVCSAAFRIVDQNSRRTILTWLLGRNRDNRLLTEFFVPTEVLIEPGVSFSLEDGPAYKAAYVACGASACKAALALDDALVSELSSATRATIALTASNGKVTRFSMAIDGIEAALAALGN